MGIEVAIAAAVVGAVATGASIYQGQKAAKENRKAMRIEQQRQDLAAARERRQAIRQARMAYAQTQQAGENQGVSATSAAAGGLANITGQLNSNLSFLDTMNSLADRQSQHFMNSASAQASAQMWGDVAGTAMAVYGASSGIPKDIFKKKKTG